MQEKIQTQVGRYKYFTDGSRLWKACYKCNGSGEWYGYWGVTRRCFGCSGNGWVGDPMTMRDAEARSAHLERAQAKRDQERDQRASKALEIEQERQASLRAREQEREVVRAARASASQWLDAEVGSKVEVEGKVVFAKTCDTAYGQSRLLIIEVTSTVSVKTFTSQAWAYDVDRGHTVVIKGTVKSHDVYNDSKSTSLTRSSLGHHFIPQTDDVTDAVRP